MAEVIHASEGFVRDFVATEQATLKKELLEEIGKLGHLEIRRVTTRPQTGESGVLYLVPSATSKQENIYDEYLWINGAWEMIGSTAVDLSGYVKKDADYDAVRTNASTGAAHAADPNPHVTSAEKQKWDAKQDALTSDQKANIDDVPNKRDKSDMFTEWVFDGSDWSKYYRAKIDIHKVDESTTTCSVWVFDGEEVIMVASGSVESPDVLEIDFSDVERFDPTINVTATRQRILTTDDVTTDLTNPTAGKAAESKAVKTAIADATKLTPVYGGIVETEAEGEFTVAVEQREAGEQKKLFVVVRRNGYEFSVQPFVEGTNEYTFDTPDGSGKAVIDIVGYTLGDKASPELITSDSLNAGVFATTAFKTAVSYALNDADANGVKDRAINKITASEVTIPDGFTDLILSVSGAVTKLTMTGITTAYGDDLPTEGNNLITVTRIAEDAVFVKVVALEDNSYAGA